MDKSCCIDLPQDALDPEVELSSPISNIGWLLGSSNLGLTQGQGCAQGQPGFVLEPASKYMYMYSIALP